MDSGKKLFKQKIHFGKAYLIRESDGTIIAKGQGQFNTDELKMYSHFENGSYGQHEDVMMVLKTNAGYFSPLRIYTNTILPLGSNTWERSMETFLHWPATKSLKYVTQQFTNFDIFIKTEHDVEESVTNPEHTETTLTKRAVRKDLATSECRGYMAKAGATYGHSWDRSGVDNMFNLTPRIYFTITPPNEHAFTVRSIYKLLDAFRLYWINSHDYKDGEITSIHLGDIHCYTKEFKLKARASNVEKYQEALKITDSLELEYLAKLVHFYMNPKNDNRLSTSSKVGLAFARMIGYRFYEPHRKIDYHVIDLVFSLQSMLEEVAGKTISETNKQSATATRAGIEKVLLQIEAIKTDLPENVRDFYLQEPGKIQERITRPSFIESVRIALKKLAIDADEYWPVIKEINKARQQVVHSEKYDGAFLVDLLTRGKTTVEKDESGAVVSMAFGVKTGSLDKLYDLIVRMIRAYLDQYAA